MQNSSKSRWLVAFIGGIVALYFGCVSEPPPDGGAAAGSDAATRPAPFASEIKDQPGTRVLKCADTDGSSAFYAVDDMTRKLGRFPSLAAYIGLTSISNCIEAIAYARGYDDYSGRNPGFEGRPDPKWSTNSAIPDDHVILPRIMVKNGTKSTDWAFPTPEHPTTKPGPVVRIWSVYWWPNGKSAIFTKTRADGNICGADQFCECTTACTATFINRSWLLTAAHCLQNVNKVPITDNDNALGPDGKTLVKAYCQNKSVPAPAPVPDGGAPMTGDSQPFKPTYSAHDSRIGYAQYVISWPSTYFYAGDSTPDIYSVQSVENYYGVGLYQFPHEEHDPSGDCDPQKQPEDCGTPNRHGPDVALLSMANWTQAAEYMTPDLDNEGAMYIGGKSASGPDPGIPLYVAGYGDPSENIGGLYGGVVNGSNGTVTFMPDWQDLDEGNMFGGYGRVTMNVTSNSQRAICSGDSGGPLYSIFSSGGTRKFIQYAVASEIGLEGSDGCAIVGGSNSWSRLEADNRLIEWINTKMTLGPVARSKEEQGKYNQCQPQQDAINGKYYKCWGDPCDGLDNSNHKCNDYQSCVGSGKQLNDQGRKCYGCRTAGNWAAGDCSCIVGYCMWDSAKLAAAASTGGAGAGGEGGAGGAGGEGGTGGAP